jgi:TorA maturation chaperone TorD
MAIERDKKKEKDEKHESSSDNKTNDATEQTGMENVGQIADEDRQRAQCYRLLSHLLARVPQEETLAVVAKLDGDDSVLGQAFAALAIAARDTSPAQADDEFHNLFIGTGRGELVPFGSFYMTGFLNEKPLARLRQDMARLGIERAEDSHEPEDGIASVCEIMAGLIEGSFGAPASLSEQAAFFDRHIAPWAPRFFADLESAKTASFYRPVGTLGQHFMDIETTAFAMAA